MFWLWYPYLGKMKTSNILENLEHKSFTLEPEIHMLTNISTCRHGQSEIMFQTKTGCVWSWLCSAYPGPSASRHYFHIRKYIRWSIRMPCVIRWPDMIKITMKPLQSVDISSLIKSIVKDWVYTKAWMTAAFFLKARSTWRAIRSHPTHLLLPSTVLADFFLISGLHCNTFRLRIGNKGSKEKNREGLMWLTTQAK